MGKVVAVLIFFQSTHSESVVHNKIYMKIRLVMFSLLKMEKNIRLISLKVVFIKMLIYF